jgi:hypothetical protein
MMFMNRLFKKTVPATGVVLLALLAIYFEEVLQMKASKLMKDAILSAVTTSNGN